jgi:hypothetical protein
MPRSCLLLLLFLLALFACITSAISSAIMSIQKLPPVADVVKHCFFRPSLPLSLFSLSLSYTDINIHESVTKCDKRGILPEGETRFSSGSCNEGVCGVRRVEERVRGGRWACLASLLYISSWLSCETTVAGRSVSFLPVRECR